MVTNEVPRRYIHIEDEARSNLSTYTHIIVTLYTMWRKIKFRKTIRVQQPSIKFSRDILPRALST